MSSVETYHPVDWDYIFMTVFRPNVPLNEYQLEHHDRYCRMHPEALKYEIVRKQILEYELTLHPEKEREEETTHHPTQ
jgi:hypothetical protein